MVNQLIIYPAPGHGKYIGQISLLDYLRGIAQIDVTSKVQRVFEDIPRFNIAGQVVINPYSPT
jgi:hypothetical protein